MFFIISASKSKIAINKSKEISKEELFMYVLMKEQLEFEQEWEPGNQNKVMMKLKKDELKSERSKINMIFK